jgi:hypothetical protein
MGFRKTKGTLLSGVLAVSIAGVAPIAFAQDDAGAAPGRGKAKNNLYIVRMADKPVVAYDGGIPGLLATKPRKGQKINPLDSKVVRYASYLDSRHDDAVARVGARKAYSYRYSFNGFAADLTAEQVEKVKSIPGVLSVEKDELYEMDTSFTPGFLGLTAPGGIWSQAKGENVIIGIIDSGVWPEQASYSDRTGVNGNATRDGKLGYQQIPGWHGKCVPGEAFTASNCNQKLIGAQYYNAGWGGNDAVKERFPFEFISPRDWGGHGTHTSTTAGGNSGVSTPGGTISGIAPRARIAAYKVCWADQPTGGGCFGSDSVAAIDQAVADGVDVLNFSISGTQTNFRDAVEIAFMFAADAGVFVAASAGNAGTTGSVAHPGPWLTTVASGTHNRDGTGSVVMNGVTYPGASLSSALGPLPIIDSTAAGLPGADPVKVELCYSAADNLVPVGTPPVATPTPVLDPAKVAGKIVVCKRGVTALVNKSGAVFAAGGKGAVIANDPLGGTNLLAILHPVPTVHMNATNGLALKAAIAATPGSVASITQANIFASAVAAPQTSSFSSRGPLTAGGGDLLKPDLMAPGTDIIAGVAPPNNFGQLFASYQGTSMSSPHVAGLGALFKELHPDWSPMMIKSALMTTGKDVLDSGLSTATRIFRQGAGHVQPNLAMNPGLVFDAGFNDWMAFICGTQPGSFCLPNQAIDPSDLNVASIAIGALAGVQTVTRRVTNVGAAATYVASFVAPPGISVVVNPSSLTLGTGQSAEFTVTFTTLAAATMNAYAGGQLTWTGGGKTVRVPMVVRPVVLAAPAAVAGNGSAMSYNVTFGYTGSFGASPVGLVPALTTAGTVADDPSNGACSLTAPNATKVDVVIPAGIALARFSLFDADVAPGADIDLCVFRGTTLVGSSGTGTSAEEVNVSSPIAATYTVVVHGWEVGAGSPFKLHTWLLNLAPAGNMTVTAPGTATTGATGTIGLTFTGLTPATRYFGAVLHTGAPGLPATLVRIDTP